MNTDKQKILVVDDDEMTTELAKTFLERHNFAVVIAKDGHEAIQLAQSEVPNLILLDVMLPTMDGFEVCKRLRNLEEFKKTPILMFTARGFSSDVEQGQAAGANEYIVKPFSGKALIATIRKHLGIEE